MSRSAPQFLRIEDRSGSVVELIPIDTFDVTRAEIVHETRMPGGFWRMTVDIPTTDDQYLRWRNDRVLYVGIVESAGLNTTWQGRLEDVEILQLGVTRLVFRGDWSKFRDAVSNNKTYTKDYNTTGDAIIDDMINGTIGPSEGFHTDTDKPSIGTLEAPGVTIDQTYSDEWNLWQVLTDQSRGVLSFANSSGQKMDLFIYENGIQYQARNPSAITWRTYVNPDMGVINDFPLRMPWAPMANAVDVIYGGSSKTAVSVNQTSIDKLVRRERTVKDVGTTTDATTGPDARRDQEITLHGDLQQEIDGFEITRVWDANGVEQPLCSVRAGDVIHVSDWMANSLNLGTVDLDALRTFVIEETRCNHRQGALTIRPDRSEASLRAIFELNRIRSTS